MQYNENETVDNDLDYDPDAPLKNDVVSAEEKQEVLKQENPEEVIQPETIEEETGEPQSKKIPYQRFKQKVDEANELSEKNRELELQLARLQGAQEAISKDNASIKQAPEPLVDIKKLRREYQEALLSGDEDGALDLQDQIDQYMEKQSELKAQEIARKIIDEREQLQLSKAAEQEKSARSKLIDKFLTDNDYLDDQSANFNEDAFEAFSAFFSSSQSKGASFEDSLAYARDKASKYAASPHIDGKPKNTKLTKEQVEEQLIRAKDATPQVSTKGTSGDPVNIDPSKMTEEEYDKFRESGGKFAFEAK